MGLDPKEKKLEAEHNFHHLKSRQGIKEYSLIPYAYKTSVAGRISLRSLKGRLPFQSAFLSIIISISPLITKKARLCFDEHPFLNNP